MRITIPCALCAIFALSGCGDAFDDVLGTYKGTSELYNATNFGMNTQTEQDVITITTSSSNEEQVIIGLDPSCSIIASVEDQTLTIASQACKFEAPNSSDTWNYEGSGTITDASLTLNLKGTFSRVYMAGPLMTPPLEGNHRLDFTGTRQ